MNAPSAEPQVDLNGRLIPGSHASISPLGEGFQYGMGLFETIRVAGGQPVFLPEHLERLRRGAMQLGLASTTSLAQWHERCVRLIQANGAEQGSLKLVIFRDVSGEGQLIQTRENPYGPEIYARGFRLQLVGDGLRTGSLGALKSLNYLRNISAKRAAMAAGYDEPVFAAANGAILEGATTNLFAVRGGRILTPPADGAILPGVVRAQVLGLLRPQGAAEEPIDAAWLNDAEEVFVTNSLLGVMPVGQIDQRRYDLERNPVTRAAGTALSALERESAAAAAAQFGCSL